MEVVVSRTRCRVLVRAAAGVAVALSYPALPLPGPAAQVIAPASLGVGIGLPAPAVAREGLNVSPPALNVSVGLPSPVVSTGLTTIAPAALPVAVALPSPAIGASEPSVTPAALALAFSLPAPNVAVLAPAVVSPAALSLSVAPSSPAVSQPIKTVAPVALGVAVALPSPVVANVGITAIGAFGDSITYAGGSFADIYAKPSGKTFTVRAMNSRTTRYASASVATLDDGSNSLYGNVTADIAAAGNPQAVVYLIGANDLSNARTAAEMKTDLAAVKAAYNAKDAKAIWGPPLPFDNNDATRHPLYAQFMSRRATLYSGLRDPTNLSPLCDGVMWLGTNPRFTKSDNHDVFGDSSGGVHPNDLGHEVLATQYQPGVDNLYDAGARAASTTMYASAWPQTEVTNLAPGQEYIEEIVVAGLPAFGGATGVGGIALTGGNELKVTGGAAQVHVATDMEAVYAASYSGWLYNTDIIKLKYTASSTALGELSIPLKIGSETRTLTRRTVAAVAPASVVYGGFAGVAPYNGTSYTFTAKTFDTGVAVVALDTGNFDTQSTGVSVGGAALTLVRRDGRLETWRGAVTAGVHNVVVTQPAGAKSRLGMQWLTVKDADPMPTAATGGQVNFESDPHEAGPLTVPASGIMVAFLWRYGAPAPTVTLDASDSGSTLLGQGVIEYQTEESGVAAAKRNTTGAVKFASGFGSYGRTAIVFKAAGT